MNRHEGLAGRCFAGKAGMSAPGMPFARHHHRHFMVMARGFLKPFAMLLLAEEPSHGYALMEKLEDTGVLDKHVLPPVVYRALRQLEKNGLAVSDQVDQGGRGPARKVYRLTEEGYEVLAVYARSMKGFSELLSDFQRRYDSLEKDQESGD